MSIKNGDKEEELIYCSFCNKDQNQCNHIIAGPNVFICSECVCLCNDILQEEHKEVVEKLTEENKKLLAQLEEKGDE